MSTRRDRFTFAGRLLDGLAIHLLPFLLLAWLLFDEFVAIALYAGFCTIAFALLGAVWPSSRMDALYSKLPWNRP